LTLNSLIVRLNVRDLQASSAFYRNLGFERFDGNDEHWLILKHGSIQIGLYEERLGVPLSLSFGVSTAESLYAAGIVAEGAADDASTRDPDGNILHFQLP
jgi:catechol 2,3-dioxygenase-like lactoylglutathione lyase family enzyme